MTEEEEHVWLRVLRTVAPGTDLREGLENVLNARTGALIVVGDSGAVLDMMDGGFRIDAELVPAYLYELAKMDGAIILSRDARRILHANAQLVPDPAIPSFETGIRHRTAERAAKQTGELVVAISQRRNIITLFKGPQKYVLRDTSVMLAKANQALQTLERYRTVLDQALTNLGALEFEDLVTAADVVTVVQRGESVSRIVREVEHYIAELGVEGRLISMQLSELEHGVVDEARLVIRDYLAADASEARCDEVRRELASWSGEELLDADGVARLILGTSTAPAPATSVSPRGHRLLRRIPRLPEPVIENLVAAFKHFPVIQDASLDQLDDVEGIGAVRARSIHEGLGRLRAQFLVDRHL